MSEARQFDRENDRPRAFPGRPRHGGTTERKRRMFRRAATVTAAGLALSLPAGTQALAQLNPVALKRLDLDAVTLGKVKAYDRYRTREATQKTKAKKALTFARKQIGKPYRWGAAGPSGYDCSGLAMAAWRKAGVKIPRVTYSQYSRVQRKVALRNLRPGDLIFFHGRSHVGIYMGHGKFLHAPNSGSRIRVEKLGAARKRQFAGAVRPGAPAYKKWSPSIRELVEKIDKMGAQENTDEAPDTTAEVPMDMPLDMSLRTQAAAEPAPPANDAAPPHDAPNMDEPGPASEQPSANGTAPSYDAPDAEVAPPTNEAMPVSDAAAAHDASHANTPANNAVPANGAVPSYDAPHAHEAAPTGDAAHANGASHANTPAHQATAANDASHTNAPAHEAVPASEAAPVNGAVHANGSAHEPTPADEGASADGAVPSYDAPGTDAAPHADEAGAVGGQPPASGAVPSYDAPDAAGAVQRRPVPPRDVALPVDEVKPPVGKHEGHGRPANLVAVQPRPAVLADGEKPVAQEAPQS